jgi:hypothetical protein
MLCDSMQSSVCEPFPIVGKIHVTDKQTGVLMPLSLRRYHENPMHKAPADSDPLGFIERFGAFSQEHNLNEGNGALEHAPARNAKDGTITRKPLINLRGLWQRLHTTFLPEGFPNSVGPDYVAYQCFDITQAMCSAVTGTLSTRAVLAGVGVGEQSANVISGTLQWIIRDGTGMVSRIYFASHIASGLDNDMKRWRIAADVCNDIGVMLEISCSMVPRQYFVPLVCSAAVIKAVTAVAGQATRSTMAQHFSRRDNMADISAKNNSQETAVSFIGMFVGMAVAAYVPPTMFYNSLVYVIVTILHLYFNVRAVRTLIITHFNQTRLDIAICKFIQAEGGLMASPSGKSPVGPASPLREGGGIPTPIEMRELEGLLIPNPFLDALPKKPNQVVLGASLSRVLSDANPAFASGVLAHALNRLRSDRYATIYNAITRVYYVVLAVDASYPDILRAYVTLQLAPAKAHSPVTPLSVIEPDARTNACYDRFIAQAAERGWKTDKALFKLQEWRIDAKPPPSPSLSG